VDLTEELLRRVVREELTQVLDERDQAKTERYMMHNEDRRATILALLASTREKWAPLDLAANLASNHASPPDGRKWAAKTWQYTITELVGLGKLELVKVKPKPTKANPKPSTNTYLRLVA
jgi:hypothetical protein